VDSMSASRFSLSAKSGREALMNCAAESVRRRVALRMMEVIAVDDIFGGEVLSAAYTSDNTDRNVVEVNVSLFFIAVFTSDSKRPRISVAFGPASLNKRPPLIGCNEASRVRYIAIDSSLLGSS